MTFLQLDQTIRYLAWFLSLAAIIHGLYILVLNTKHSANRHVCALLLLIAINSFAAGLLIGAMDLQQATLPAQMIAVTLPAIQPLLLVTTVAMLKPERLSGRKRVIFVPIYLLTLTPLLLAYADERFGTSLWFTNLASQTFLPGLDDFVSYSPGNLALIFRYIFFIITPALLIISLVYATFDKKSSAEDKRLAGFLLIGNLFSILLLLGLSSVVYPSLALLIANAIYILVYVIGTFQQMLSGKRVQTGSIQKRMTGVILVTVLPILLALVIFMTARAQQVLEEKDISGLRNTSRTLSATTSLWLDQNARTIRALASQPAIQSMDPERQTPILSAMATEYPEIYLISTTDLAGLNVSRSDGSTPVDYSDRDWFQEAIRGAPLAMQTTIDQVNGKPSLVLAAPIKDAHDDILGVVMLATDLELVKNLLTTGIADEQQFIYVINENNQAIIHPNPDYTTHLFDLSQYPPVAAMREGEIGTIKFEDKYGRGWRAVGAILENDWAVFAQVREAQLASQTLSFQRVSWIAFIIGVFFLILMSSLAIRQTILPIHSLTATVTAMAAGDLTQVAPVETEDEIGLLARTFNSMTSQIRDLISGLERRVSERTRDLEKRAVQLQVTAEVAREAAEIRDLERLLDHSVRLISKRFSFYHAGIFLVDENQEYAVLRAASSEGGKRMLARGHKLKIGQEGIVGFVAAEGEPRIALDVGSDAIFFNNPDLPQTRSEMALPLMVREVPTGVLDVQSTKASAFTEEDIAILQILADQIALAIDNTRLLQESQQSLDELQNLYSNNVNEAWHNQLANKSIGYTYNRLGVEPLDTPSGMADQLDRTGSRAGHGPPLNDDDPYLLHVPLTLRGQVLGYLQLKREAGQTAWTPEETETVSSIVIQLSLALENARLLAEIRQHARNEQLIGHIASQVQSSLDIETVMKRTVMEIGQAFRANKVRIQLGNETPPSNGHNSTDEDLPWS